MRYSSRIYDSDRRLHPLIEEIQALIFYRGLIGQFVSRSIITRYKRSFLGVAWTILNPLLTMTIITLVFSNIFRFQVDNYPIYVLTSLIIWSFFTGSTNAAMGNMVFSGKLMSRIYIPKSIFAVSAVGTSLINLGFSIGPLLIIMLFTGVKFTAAIFILPFSVFFITMFSLGLSLILAAAAIYFADMIPVYEVLLKIWIYATPIFYPEEILPPEYAVVFQFNPMVHLLALFREPLHQGTIPEFRTWLIAGIFAVFTLVVGGLVFTSKTNEYAYRV